MKVVCFPDKLWLHLDEQNQMNFSSFYCKTENLLNSVFDV